MSWVIALGLAAGCGASTPGGPLDELGERPDLGGGPDPVGTPDLAERPDLGGQLDPTVTDPTGTVDLTAQGALDWLHWGLSSERSVTRKHTVEPCISDVRLIDRGITVGNNELHQYVDNHVRFSWSDGAPATSATGTSTGIFVLGPGRGFGLSAPADERPRTLRIYLSGFLADFEVTARLSDGSAWEFREVVTGRATGPGIYRQYTFVYRSLTPGQRIDVEWVNLKSYAGGGNVTVQAATLE